MFSAKKKTAGLSIFIAALIGVSGSACNSSGTSTTTTSTSSGTGTGTSNAGNCTNCSAITPENFVTALVQLAQSGQIASGYASTTLAKEQSVQTGWFVIWDGGTQNYQAVHVVSSDITGYCANGGATCSNINPQAAALAFTQDGNIPVYSKSTTVTGTNGTSAVGNTVVGVQTSGSFGTEGLPPLETYNNSTGQWVDQTSGLPYVNPVGNYIAGYSVTPSQNGLYTDTYGEGSVYSQTGDTRDTDLQQANLQSAGFVQRAAAVSANFQMDFSKAVQLTTLSDKLASLQSAGQAISGDDRTAVMQSLSGIVGVTSDQLNTAVVQQLKGNSQPTQDLVETISKNLGMPSSATLKNQILPQLGLDIN